MLRGVRAVGDCMPISEVDATRSEQENTVPVHAVGLAHETDDFPDVVPTMLVDEATRKRLGCSLQDRVRVQYGSRKAVAVVYEARPNEVGRGARLNMALADALSLPSPSDFPGNRVFVVPYCPVCGRDGVAPPLPEAPAVLPEAPDVDDPDVPLR